MENEWWKRYPQPGWLGLREAGDDEHPDPRLAVGVLVRLHGKPDKPRRVLSAEWHGYRHRYVYRVETSGYSLPYWFSDQLVLEGGDEPLLEAVTPSFWQKWTGML